MIGNTNLAQTDDMTTYQLLAPMADYLVHLHRIGFRLADAEYITLYADYQKMLDENLKKTYIVAHLSESYNISERKVYNLIRGFERFAQGVQSLTNNPFGQLMGHH